MHINSPKATGSAAYILESYKEKHVGANVLRVYCMLHHIYQKYFIEPRG